MTSDWLRMGFPPAIFVVVTTSACIFNFEDFKPPPSETGGAGGGILTGAATGAGGSAGAGSMGTAGGGGESDGSTSSGAGGKPIVCPDPTNVANNTIFHQMSTESSCYTFFTEKLNRDEAKSACGTRIVNSYLVTVTDMAEHEDIVKWLTNSDVAPMNASYSGPWTGGKKAGGYFKWLGGQEDWNTSPCDPNIVDCNHMLNLWAIMELKWVTGSSESFPQPDYSGDCVKYGVWAVDNPSISVKSVKWARTGLHTIDCNQEKGYVCEWKP